MNLPCDFEQSIAAHLGQEEYDRLSEALSLPAPTSIRLNQEKAEQSELETLQYAEGVPWCAGGFYLKERPQFTFDPLFHAGCYYVQEASSMFLSHVLRQYIDKPVVALDMCAAPGGKSTLALSQLPEGSLLVANEAIRQRASILAENITKWGNPNCIVTSNYAEDFHAFGGVFDLIICDAPCSGEGMFRKDPASIEEWSLANVEACRKRQRDIVSNIWHTLKEGGIFIYSTCTYNQKENEENVEWMLQTLGAEALPCNPMPEWNLTDKNTHFYPHKNKGEGFFISVLRKTSESSESERGRKKKEKGNKKGKPTAKIPAELQNWLTDSQAFTFTEENGTYQAFPTPFIDLLQLAKATLKVIHAGIGMATLKGKSLQPCQSLAMSQNLNRQAFPAEDVTLQQAIAYLRSESLQLSETAPRGYVLITYQDHPLGFAKNIGNRANNLYPAEWRIKKAGVQIPASRN